MKHSLFLLLLLSFISCKQKFYSIPSGNMEATLPVNSKVMVTVSDEFDRNDIAVFDYYGPDYLKGMNPDGNFTLHWEKHISRIIGVSGDSLYIRDAEIYINGKRLPRPEKSLLRHEVFARTALDDLPQRNEQESMPPEATDSGYRYTLTLTRAEANDFKNRKSQVVSVRKLPEQNSYPDSLFASECGRAQTTTDDYGPVYIPRPGDTIEVKPCNRKLYQQIPGIRDGRNIITEKLYFLIGDNWYFSQDSRFTGFIAHSKMYGRVKESGNRK